MAELALYGNIGMLRDRCPKCRDTALIVDGKFVCCGTETDVKPTRIKVEVYKRKTRTRWPTWLRRSIIARQRGSCVYCDREFDAFIVFRGRPRQLRVNIDHFVPWKWCKEETADNLYACCDICNAWKRTRIFESVSEVRKFVADKWEKEEGRAEDRLLRRMRQGEKDPSPES